MFRETDSTPVTVPVKVLENVKLYYLNCSTHRKQQFSIANKNTLAVLQHRRDRLGCELGPRVSAFKITCEVNKNRSMEGSAPKDSWDGVEPFQFTVQTVTNDIKPRFCYDEGQEWCKASECQGAPCIKISFDRRPFSLSAPSLRVECFVMGDLPHHVFNVGCHNDFHGAACNVSNFRRADFHVPKTDTLCCWFGDQEFIQVYKAAAWH